MPNARELLEQADALMRRGRQRADEDLPVLTDVVEANAAAGAAALAPALAPVPVLDDALVIPAVGATADDRTPKLADPRAQELAEQVYMQVLQSLDLYTEKALQEHLAQHLQPVIERAGREIVAAVNANIGKLLRTFIAESIERHLGELRAEQTGDDESR
jgi:hypothetical protein